MTIFTKYRIVDGLHRDIGSCVVDVSAVDRSSSKSFSGIGSSELTLNFVLEMVKAGIPSLVGSGT